jgi:hypothetical protein
MKRARVSSLAAAVALALPLAGLSAYVWHGAVNRSHGALGRPSAGRAPAGPLPGLPTPEADLSRDRLEERVDGAADALRVLGCRRLLHWRLAELPGDLELLVFDDARGAGTALARDAGPERTAGPGEEAHVSPQAAYFRRGFVFVRLLLDPGSSAGEALARRASEVDRAILGASRRL